MAENSALDKTEEATPKRLQKAREKGNVPKSPELNSVFILFFGLLTLYFLSTGILNRLISIFKSFYQQAGSMTITNS
ncbi:MAG: EscU/YscU/HrcU family type III secretion system export apparatus switch protein, partial [Desulfobacterales bacterium]